MRGLLCIEPLYHQIVAGNKTQTRRSGGLSAVNDSPYEWEINGQTTVEQIFPIGGKGLEEVYFITKEYIPYGEVAGKLQETCKPRYRVGEVMYLKEPITEINYPNRPGIKGVFYKYGMVDDRNDKLSVPSDVKWSNKLFMPASAARAFIKITGIRCERLLDISDADCIAEGIETSTGFSKMYGFGEGYYFNTTSHIKDSFLSLYKFANKVKEVENIWCWVYEFEYLKDYKP